MAQPMITANLARPRVGQAVGYIGVRQGFFANSGQKGQDVGAGYRAVFHRWGGEFGDTGLGVGSDAAEQIAEVGKGVEAEALALRHHSPRPNLLPPRSGGRHGITISSPNNCGAN